MRLIARQLPEVFDWCSLAVYVVDLSSVSIFEESWFLFKLVAVIQFSGIFIFTSGS